ncbi:MAG TPA: DHA2 family efflux MFS transporter permease subunit [Armatimonadota bacterium]|jgi:DHA2 family multidrug resistance protein
MDEVQSGGAPPIAAAPAANRWLITLAVTVGTLMGAIDTSIVNVALPHIQSSLGVTITEATWISTAYLIALVIIMPLTAWLAGVFGRKRTYMFCLGLFLVASFFCGNAATFSWLVIFRALQGIGAGALQPTEQAILRETFPLEEQGMAMALYGIAVMIGPAIGPSLGGWLTENISWRWIFFINIPIGIAGMLMVWRFVHDPPYLVRKRVRVDYVGIALLAVGLATLQTVLEQGQTNDWFSSSLIVALSVVAAVCLTGFVWWELRTLAPAVDLRLLKIPSFLAGTSIGGVLGLSLFSGMFLLPLFMQTLLGYTALQSGMALIPRTLAMMAMMPVVGVLFNRLGARKMVASGLLVAAYAGWMMSHFTTQTSLAQLIIPQIVQGVGFSLIFVALSTSSLALVPREKMTNATGMYNLVRQLGGSFGVAIFATLLEKRSQTLHAQFVVYANPYNPAFQQRIQALQTFYTHAGADVYTAHQRALATVDGIIQQQAAVLSFERLFIISVFLLALCVPMVLTLRDRVTRG